MWDFPMLPMRFVESSCLKCHHQVTDLIGSDNRNEAPKLLRGFNLIKENGCFGCHEIAGRKGGRQIGPDLRLEPTPPLDSLTPQRTRQDRGRRRQCPGHPAQGRPEPVPPQRKDQRGLGRQVAAVAARFPPGHQDAALLRPEQQRRGRPCKAAGPEEVSRHRNLGRSRISSSAPATAISRTSPPATRTTPAARDKDQSGSARSSRAWRS